MARKSKKDEAVEAMNAPPGEFITFDREVLESVLNAIKALMPECRMHVLDKAITVMGVDTANVAMLSLTMREEAFMDFRMKPCEIGVDCDRLAIGLKTMDGPKVDLIKIDESRFVLTDGLTRFEYPALDCNVIRKDPNPLALALPGCITLNHDALANAIVSVALIGEKAAFILESDRADEPPRLNIDCEGPTDRLIKQVPMMPDGDEVEVGVRGTWRSLFSLDYLKDFAKVFKAAKGTTVVIKLELGDDNPVKMSLEIAPGVMVQYLLAPRIEAD